MILASVVLSEYTLITDRPHTMTTAKLCNAIGYMGNSHLSYHGGTNDFL